MKKLVLFCLIANFHAIFIYTQQKYPADISYMVADFKYSQEHGLKICEVQHGNLSALNGDLNISGNNGIIAPMIADFFSQFPLKKWATELTYVPLKKSFATKEWNILSLKKILKDPEFLACAASSPTNPASINSYAGIVYSNSDIVINFESYSKTCPGILFVNAATFPYWMDKYKINALFDLNEELQQYKADWKLYSKKYDPLLADKIQADMPCDLYVIKPRGEALGNGVIVVASEDLDATLRMILQPLPSFDKHADKKYAYWSKNRDDSFLVEKYYESDSLCFPAPLNEKTPSQTTSEESQYHYDTTMRLAFILQYDHGKMSYHSFGGFCKLPSKALEEQGTLNEKRTSYGHPPFYKAIEPELLQEIDTHMERAMLLLYEIMLNQN